MVESIAHSFVADSCSLHGPAPFQGAGDAAFPATNRIILAPVAVPNAMRCVAVAVSTPATVSGNILYGLYDRFGNRLMTSVSAAQAASSLMFTACDVQLGRDIYYLAVSLDNTTGRLNRVSPGSAAMAKAAGMKYVDPGSFTLPATITMLDAADAYIPSISLYGAWAGTDSQIVPHLPRVHVYSPECLGQFSNSWLYGAASAAFPVINLAHYVPITVRHPIRIDRMYCVGGSAVAGNFDIGIYSEGKRLIASTGAVAQTAVNDIQIASLQAAITLSPGRYYLAMSVSNVATARYQRVVHLAYRARTTGCAIQTSAHPLPASAVFAAVASHFMPIVGLIQEGM